MYSCKYVVNKLKLKLKLKHNYAHVVQLDLHSIDIINSTTAHVLHLSE